jgi:hypothetical protein
MVVGSRCALSIASTHCLISVSDAHSRSRMAVRWTGSSALTAALNTACTRFASTAMASFLKTSLASGVAVLESWHGSNGVKEPRSSYCLCCKPGCRKIAYMTQVARLPA